MNDKVERAMEIYKFAYDGMGIPDYMQEGLLNYIEDRALPGGFLQAVLENNLSKAVEKADSTNMWLLPVYVAYLYNCTPTACWGSPEKVAKWIFKDKPGFTEGK